MDFFGAIGDNEKVFLQILDARMLKKGTYTVSGDVLNLQETEATIGTKKMPSDMKWEYKFKKMPNGFQYIHVAPKSGKKNSL